MRKGGRDGWRVKKGGEREGARDVGGGRDGGTERGKEGRRMGTRAKPGNQLVYHICIHLLKEYSSLQDNPHNVRFIHTVLIVHNYFAPWGVDNVLISESSYCTAVH